MFIAIVLWTFSRVLLQLSHTAATATALAVAVGILAVAAFVASRKQVGSGAVFSMIGGVFGVTMLAGGVALLVGQPSEGEGEAVIVAIAAPEGAAENGYATTTLDAPADEAFTIAFDNEDPGVQHNVAIAEEEGGTPFFEGTLVAGPIQTEYPIEPLPAADYFFFCTAHPTVMTGTLKVAAGAEPGGGGGGEGPPTVVAKDLRVRHGHARAAGGRRVAARLRERGSRAAAQRLDLHGRHRDRAALRGGDHRWDRGADVHDLPDRSRRVLLPLRRAPHHGGHGGRGSARG